MSNSQWYNRQYYLKNIQKPRKRKDTKKRLEYEKEYREKNKEKIAEYQKKYRQENKERLQEYNKNYKREKRWLDGIGSYSGEIG